MNEPWSGKEGFMFAADCLKNAGQPGKRQALMIEFRNDLLSDPVWCAKAAHCLAQAVRLIHVNFWSQGIW